MLFSTVSWRKAGKAGSLLVLVVLGCLCWLLQQAQAQTETGRPRAKTSDDVSVTASEATLLLFRDADAARLHNPSGAAPKLDQVGGTVEAVLQIKVLGKQGVAPTTQTVTVRRQEEPDLARAVTHSPQENHVDKVVDLRNVAEWEKWDGAAWVASPEVPTTPNTNEEPVFYRARFAWNTAQPTAGTTGTLLGHNGEHTLSVAAVNGDGTVKEVEFVGTEEGSAPYRSGPEQQRKVDVQNLVIAGVQGSGNPDYIKFDPDSENESLKHPTITFAIENKGDPQSSPHRYRWWLWLRQTSIEGPSSFVTYEGNMDAPGQQAVTINKSGANYTRDADLQGWGTYAFDIRVQDTKTGDLQSVRSDKINIPSTMPGAVDENGNSRLGHELIWWHDEEGNIKWRASYYLQSDRDASEARVDLLDPFLSNKASLSGPATKNTPHLDLDLYTPTEQDEFGDYVGVFTAADDHKEHYRDHQNRPMLSINQRKQPKKFHIEEDWIKINQTTWKALSESRKLNTVYGACGWIVQNTGVKGAHEVMDVDNSDYFDWQNPQHYNTRTYNSSRIFDHYNVRHRKRYVNVIGANESESDNLFGMANADGRWSYTYVGTIKKAITGTSVTANDINDATIKTTIHEVGHQLLPVDHAEEHHSENDNTVTRNGKLCVMDPGIPGPLTDFWFCPYHANRIRTSNWPID